ncbi:hypothetical protein DVH24_039288 [Malus domestica]|uniref:Uncharacterized protein n=1 Tax=Malus domestica TaxID=3750 RepID=A0A498HY86_MALDO|nr:hypothetical protein DVH24_039288 [Malus domestica]
MAAEDQSSIERDDGDGVDLNPVLLDEGTTHSRRRMRVKSRGEVAGFCKSGPWDVKLRRRERSEREVTNQEDGGRLGRRAVGGGG